MKIYTVHQAKTQLSKLIQKALRGEDVIIAKGRKPIIRLTTLKRRERKLGFLGKGVWMSPDFDRPLRDFRVYQ